MKSLVKYYVLAFMLNGEVLPIDDFKTIRECRTARSEEARKTTSIKVVCIEQQSEVMR